MKRVENIKIYNPWKNETICIY